MINRRNVLLKESLRAVELGVISSETVATAGNYGGEKGRFDEKGGFSKHKSRNQRVCDKESVSADMKGRTLGKNRSYHQRMLSRILSCRTAQMRTLSGDVAEFHVQFSLPL